ncbi:hypothetical protein [Microcystis phage Mel-JY01]
MKIKKIIFEDINLYNTVKNKMLLKYKSPTYRFLKNEIIKRYISVGGKYHIQEVTINSPVYEVISYTVRGQEIDTVHFRISENKNKNILSENSKSVLFENGIGKINSFEIDKVYKFGMYAIGINKR